MCSGSNAACKLLFLSRNRFCVERAILEWDRLEDELEHMPSPVPCELCGCAGVEVRYTISNQGTDRSLQVCEQCASMFSPPRPYDPAEDICIGLLDVQALKTYRKERRNQRKSR